MFFFDSVSVSIPEAEVPHISAFAPAAEKPPAAAASEPTRM
jgi:hypothetical protein